MFSAGYGDTQHNASILEGGGIKNKLTDHHMLCQKEISILLQRPDNTYG
jgi:hypothetical protein